MPYLQRRRLTAAGDISGDDPFRFKLPQSGKFAGFEIEIRCQRENARTLIAEVYPIETQLDKIEMLRGGTRPIISLTGQQLDAMNYWDFKVPNPRRYRQEDATEERLALFLLGGCNLEDREYGFDMEKLGETYLEIDHSLTADATDKFDVSTSLLDIYAYQWMGQGIPNFKGYFRSRQLAYWTSSAADVIRTVSIPFGNPIRRVCVQAGTRAMTVGGTIKDIELVVNDNLFSPVHIKSPMRWLLAEAAEYGLHNLIGGIDYFVSTGGSEIPRWWSYYQTVHVGGFGATSPERYNATFISLPARISALTTGDKEGNFISRGWGFQKCLRIGFDKHADGFDLLRPNAAQTLDLLCIENAASRVARVFVQDVVSY